MVEMSKYEPLEHYLRACSRADVPMTFAEIEKIIGDGLPSSAFRHRPWWSNNPSNSVITNAWLRAGYKSADVDMTGRKLVFRKSAKDSARPRDRRTKPQGDDPEGLETPRQSIISHLASALNGTVTVYEGIDLTEPVDTEWNEAR